MATVGAAADRAAGPVDTGPVVATGRSPLSFLNTLRVGDMLAIAPFVVFAVLFLLLPMVNLLVQAFQAQDGSFTLANIGGLFSDNSATRSPPPSGTRSVFRRPPPSLAPA
jgi:putative spermidine/putrescine transport system permease protein